MARAAAATSDPGLGRFGLRVLDDVCEGAIRDGRGTRWQNIEHRNEPPELPAQTSYMQGAAGIGAALLRGYRHLSGGPLGPWLPSWPFTD